MRFSLCVGITTALAVSMLLAACAASSAADYQVFTASPVSSPTHITAVYHTATSQPSSTVTITPSPPTPPVTPSPLPFDDPDYFYGGLTVTLDHVGQTIQLKKRENFLLRLGQDYDWEVTIAPETVISRNMRLTLEPGEQGVYVARGIGNATLRAVGEPKCRFSRPACARPAVLFEAVIQVK